MMRFWLVDLRQTSNGGRDECSAQYGGRRCTCDDSTTTVWFLLFCQMGNNKIHGEIKRHRRSPLITTKLISNNRSNWQSSENIHYSYTRDVLRCASRSIGVVFDPFYLYEHFANQIVMRFILGNSEVVPLIFLWFVLICFAVRSAAIINIENKRTEYECSDVAI